MLLIAQKRALEMVAAGESLTGVLEELCDAIDAQTGIVRPGEHDSAMSVPLRMGILRDDR
jgi:hypothetical protein